MMTARESWRSYPLDGAVMWFQPRTGLHVRWDALQTRALQRAAPRVVMFGITNRCNLACHFCSRDRGAPSEWTADGAFAMLAGLAEGGVLEIAFGGGEPLAFAGFDALLERLANETPLALHFTTNGILLTEERLRRLRPHTGEIRLSIYDDNPWESRVELLARAGGAFGVNILVTPRRLRALPALLERLHALGCRDAALLSYVGSDAAMHLSSDDERQLAKLVAESPIRARLSVCLGDRLAPLPRLFDGVDGDCGAGSDFAVLTSDRRLKACSFHGDGIAVESASDVLRAWREQRERLRAPSPLAGCARARGQTATRLSDGVRVWRGFSGNNSGDCVLVGRFAEVSDAREFIAALLPGFRPGVPFSDEWLALLAEAGIEVSPTPDTPYAPDAIAVSGRTVLLHTDEAADDDFPQLRTLLWKRGGRAIYSGIHEHDRIVLLAGLRFPDAAALEAAQLALHIDEMAELERRGLDLFGVIHPHGQQGQPDAIDTCVAQLERVAAQHGAQVACELLPVELPVDLPGVLAARAPDASPQRLWAHFESVEAAASLAKSMNGKVTVAGRYLIVEANEIRSRDGFHVQRAGGVAELVAGPILRLTISLWPKDQTSPALDPVEMASALRAYLRPEDRLDGFGSEWRSLTGSVDSDDPGATLSSLVAFAHSRDVAFFITAAPPRRLVDATARIAADLKLLRPR